MVSAPPLPTFIIIGAQKSATRWLRHNLGRHPEIFTARREVKYFNHPTRVAALGADWYSLQFDGWAGEPVIGEATPGYMMLGHRPAEVAARIEATVPAVRLIAVLRNPVDRACSAFVHHKRQERIHPRARLLDVVRNCTPEDDWMGIITGGWYAASLQPYVDLFGDRLLVLLYDDMGPDPRNLYERAVRHVGAAPGFVPPSLNEVVFSNRGDADPGVSEPERCELFAYFRNDVERLEQMLGRDLSMWRPETRG
jgi:Sulfotransferase domain